MAFTPIVFFLFHFISKSSADTSSWVRAAYYYSGSEISASDINAKLFSHLICAFAHINYSNYEIFINASDKHNFLTFTDSVERQNPSVTTLLSIWGGGSSSFSSLLNHSSHRKSFIDSSIKTARVYGFHGIDLIGVDPTSSSDTVYLGTLLKEWRSASNLEATNSAYGKGLMLVMAGYHLPEADSSFSYPFDSMQKNLDWVQFVAYGYYTPQKNNITGFNAALYGPNGMANTDHGIQEWRRRGFSYGKLLIGLPYHGYAWAVDQGNNGVGVPASGPAFTKDGSMGYKLLKSYIRSFGEGSAAEYNSSYVVNQFKIASTWINFDDVEAIRAKVCYARRKGLLGYIVFQVSNDQNWILTSTAYEIGGGHHKRGLLGIVMPTSLVLLLILILRLIFYCYHKGIVAVVIRILCTLKRSLSTAEKTVKENDSDLLVFNYATIKVATNKFSNQNKIGEGGFGIVHKGKLRNGQEIAVKRLSKTSSQGIEEFKNEVTLTARLQHVNLVRLVGYSTERDEKMLIYEYVVNRSLDHFLFDPIKSIVLDWNKRLTIIEGIIQGLLYLQEYSNFTIVHRDLKASNVLLDGEMNPKISDFGMARMFRKDEVEANTGRIVGTYGYVPPEYVRKGTYSMKYDVYSFGVLLLQIISGKRTSCYYGTHKNMNLLEYAYEMWEERKAQLEFIDVSIDDTKLQCKVMRCMQIGLLCVQEDPIDRPTMLQVYSVLKSEVAIATPKIPAFSTSRDKNTEEICDSRTNFSLINDVTVSQMLPR